MKIGDVTRRCGRRADTSLLKLDPSTTIRPRLSTQSREKIADIILNGKRNKEFLKY